METVSVIVPFYKNLVWLEQALESVCLQTYSSVETIVVNDGGVEDASGVINRFRSLHGMALKYIVQDNGGPGLARNKGMEAAKGELIAFLDSDDIWLPEKLEKQVDKLKETGADWCISSYFYFKNDGSSREIKVEPVEGRIYPLPLLAMHIATPSVIVRTNLLKEYNLKFQEDYRVGEDTLLWAAFSRVGRVCTVQEPLLRVRDHGSNAAKDVSNLLISRVQILESLEKEQSFKEIPYAVILAYKMCRFIYSRVNRSFFSHPLFVRIGYGMAWAIFHIYKKLYVKQFYGV